ncbi:ribonuclease H-like protein [Phanerochaete sordida]|uniref:Ribonuclease H-like protein n=1 Tax=Phanerochaete sordida TaxID=48140 RepID=A0A9P3GPT2_9APHY|nr:ribonuclease H-like protein [Phanerochaete sordida]
MSTSKFSAPPAQDQIHAISCAVVGIGASGDTHMVARVSIVDYKGNVIYDHFVQPTNAVADHRTNTTGITAANLRPEHGALPFATVQQQVAAVIRGKVIVGHSLWMDLSVLGIPHPAVNTRDVGLYQPFRNSLQITQLAGLATLTWRLMRRRIQDNGLLCPLENARAALDLYRSHASEWEKAVSDGHWPAHLPPSTFSRCYL